MWPKAVLPPVDGRQFVVFASVVAFYLSPKAVPWPADDAYVVAASALSLSEAKRRLRGGADVRLGAQSSFRFRRVTSVALSWELGALCFRPAVR